MAECAVTARGLEQFSPNLRGATWVRNGADEWELTTVDKELERPEDAAYVIDARFNVDGRGHLFLGRAADSLSRRNNLNPSDPMRLFEGLITGTYCAFLLGLGALYEAGGYHGQVDIGLAVTGIRGAVTITRELIYGRDAYNADSYPRTERVAAGELVDPEAVTLRMLRHLLEVSTGVDGYNPFE
jgi:hypothetical protein